MRRLTGTFDGIDYTVIEHLDGQVECPPDLAELLRDDDDQLPTGTVLEKACQLLFADSLRIEEVD